jgi:hypothetical protein
MCAEQKLVLKKNFYLTSTETIAGNLQKGKENGGYVDFFAACVDSSSSAVP